MLADIVIAARPGKLGPVMNEEDLLEFAASRGGRFRVPCGDVGEVEGFVAK